MSDSSNLFSVSQDVLVSSIQIFSTLQGQLLFLLLVGLFQVFIGPFTFVLDSITPDSTPAAIITTTTTLAPNEIELPQGILDFFPCNVGTQCSGPERLKGGGITILIVAECIQFCVGTVASEGLSQVLFEEGTTCECYLSGKCIISDAPPGELTQVYSKGSDEACP